MGLKHLSIRQFRCFPAVDIELSPQINVVEGKNASGKTSILEAIFLLSRGRSFRTPHLETALRQGEEEFYLAARIANRASIIDVSLKSEEHTSELQSPKDLVCRLLLEKK